MAALPHSKAYPCITDAKPYELPFLLLGHGHVLFVFFLFLFLFFFLFLFLFHFLFLFSRPKADKDAQTVKLTNSWCELGHLRRRALNSHNCSI